MEGLQRLDFYYHKQIKATYWVYDFDEELIYLTQNGEDLIVQTHKYFKENWIKLED